MPFISFSSDVLTLIAYLIPFQDTKKLFTKATKTKPERSLLILLLSLPWRTPDPKPSLWQRKPTASWAASHSSTSREEIFPHYWVQVRHIWSAGPSSGLPRTFPVVSSERSECVHVEGEEVPSEQHFSTTGVESSSLEIFKTSLDVVLSNLLWVSLLEQEGRIRWPPDILSKLIYFTILWNMTLDFKISDTAALGKPRWVSKGKEHGCAKDFLTSVNLSSGKLWKTFKSRLLNSRF